MSSIAAMPPRDALRASELFGALPPAEIEAVLGQAMNRSFARGDTILRRGDAGSGMLVILSGRVRVGVTSEDGREVTLGLLGPGDILGEMSLLDDEPRSADVSALEDGSALVLERGRFLRLLRDRPELAIRLLAVLSKRLRRANAAVEDIALLDLGRRLGRLLRRLAREHGQPAKGNRGVRIEVPLSQRDLAGLVGASREKVNRHLRDWEQEGVLAKEGRHIVVVRPEALADEDA